MPALVAAAYLARHMPAIKLGKVGAGSLLHVLDGERVTLCPLEREAAVTGRADSVPADAQVCKPCVSVAVKRLTDSASAATMPTSNPEGETVPAKKTAAAKPDTDELISDVYATIDRIKQTLSEGAADAAEKAEALRVEADELIKQLPRAKHTALRKEVADALKTEQPAPAPAPIVRRAADPMDIAGIPERVSAGAAKVRESVDHGFKLASAGEAVAHIILDMRTRITDPKTGLPDLLSDSKVTKNAAGLIYAEARKGVAEDDVATLDAHAALQKAVQNKMSDVLVDWLRAFDTTEDPAVIAELFPAAAELLAADDELKPSAAIRKVYAQRGVTLPERGRTEIERERKAVKALETATKALSAAQERAEDGDSAAQAEAERLAKRVTELKERVPAEAVKQLEAAQPAPTRKPIERSIERLVKSRDLLSAVTDKRAYGKLDDKEKAELIGRLEALSGFLSVQVAALKES